MKTLLTTTMPLSAMHTASAQGAPTPVPETSADAPLQICRAQSRTVNAAPAQSFTGAVRVCVGVGAGRVRRPLPGQRCHDRPGGPAAGSRKVVHGGSWHESSGSWRTAFRKPDDADYRGIGIGFCQVRTVD